MCWRARSVVFCSIASGRTSCARSTARPEIFVSVYGFPLAELEKSWRAFLQTQPLDARDEARAKERFRRPAIFHKVCARELAERVAEARERMGSMPEMAVNLLDSVCRDEPDEPAYRLD